MITALAFVSLLILFIAFALIWGPMLARAAGNLFGHRTWAEQAKRNTAVLAQREAELRALLGRCKTLEDGLRIWRNSFAKYVFFANGTHWVDNNLIRRCTDMTETLLEPGN